MWPLYLRVDDINGNESNRFENSILCGAIYGRTRPNDLLIDNLLTRLEDRPIVIASAGKVWHISAKIYRGVADMAAQQALFGIPRWNSDYGCSKCLLRGIRVDGSQVWFNQDGTQAQMRSPESYLSDGDLQINGIQRVTAAMRVMPPSIFSSDALHVCSEGITKDRLQGRAVQRMKKCLLATSTHTYANAIILAIEDLPNCSGSEIDEVAFVAFPVLAAVSAIPSPVAAASLIGYWLSLRMIAKTTRLTTDVIEIAQRIAGITKALWISMAPGIFTMKCHWFFDHGMRAELDRFPMHTFVNDDMYIPTNSFVEEVINEHQCFLKLQYGDIPLSRLVIRGKVYASRTYWKRPRSSRQDVVELKGVSSDDDTSFGSILLFLYNRNSNSVKVVLEEFVVSDPFVDLGNQVNHVPHPCRRLALQLMRMVVEHNHFFKKIDAQSIRVRSAADILGPSCLLDYGTASYVSVV
ncbi:unnamed protein product [Heligmosomoides polygyrus]|uniref:BTB domain-containing protein n=1 Tax=Heligmosomoides polygyrus TaxID=6339 RepID=A0A183F5K2_HELPZ|nr:unnamed protein product [Heligmosomoides polygyrus]